MYFSKPLQLVELVLVVPFHLLQLSLVPYRRLYNHRSFLLQWRLPNHNNGLQVTREPHREHAHRVPYGVQPCLSAAVIGPVPEISWELYSDFVYFDKAQRRGSVGRSHRRQLYDLVMSASEGQIMHKVKSFVDLFDFRQVPSD